MFINDNHHNSHQDYYGSDNQSSYNKGKLLVYLMYFFLFFSFVIIIFFIFRKPNNKQIAVVPVEKEKVSSSTNKLPIDNIRDIDVNSKNYSINVTQTEKFLFGDFYKKPEKYASSTILSYDLPINVKIDVRNYYEISRKINLDSYIDEINNNGFTIIEKNIGLGIDNVDNFFDLNRILIKNEIPVVLSSDFIIYYYQNVLKNTYKDIQKNAFYKNVWDLSKKMYDIALYRYMHRFSKTGLENDQILEGERLELAFFATMLKILEPKENQIELDANLKNLDKFNEAEVNKFSFYLPEFLKDDVEKEIEFIKEAKQERKSSVMRYPVNYAKYIVPDDYKINTKLNNFYIAMKWMNSSFPLYYKTEDCENCLLDREDWIINFIASSFITKDFTDNQELKNKWSIIYKFISFFSGLRNDLTYLQYNDSFVRLFGEDYDIEDIFSSDNQLQKENISAVQKELSKYNFSDINGSFDRKNKEQKPLIGMRILQESYWPNKYIFKKLTGKEIIANFSIEDYKKNRGIADTVCFGKYKNKEKNIKKMYRCKASAYDLINIFHPLKLNNDYLARNLDYDGYYKQINLLKKDFSKFNKYTWNSNIYWILMDLKNNLFDYEKNSLPIFYKSDDWETERTYNTILGAWVNLHLANDVYDNYNNQSGDINFDYFDCNNYNYIEPNIDLVNELIARNDMLLEIFSMLDINKSTNIASDNIKELNKKLNFLATIIKKELSNKVMDEKECIFLDDFLKAYVVTNKKENLLKGNDYLLKQSIKGMKVVLVVYNYKDRKMIGIGPIFNYKEE